MIKTFHALTVAILLLGLCACDSKPSADANLASETNTDWAGVYTGKIPSASGSGINVTITLHNDRTYEARYQYIDHPNDDLTAAGTFKWNMDAGVITLDNTDIAPYYKIGENKLTQLDTGGRPITGALADNYVLRKQ